jgi:phosphoribosylanthranilate isomerase
LKIKICGLTRPEDVTLACQLGADVCGFVLAPSPRQISWESLADLRMLVPTAVLTVAVMVDPSQDQVDQALSVVDRVQLHGQESPRFCRRYGRRAWKALRIRQAGDLDLLDDYDDVGAFLLDSFMQGVAGGTGQTFPWSYLEGRRFPRTTFLAGGLNSTNVADAAKVPSVHGLDVSSGVEAKPGQKCPHQMKEFFAAARPAG